LPTIELFPEGVTFSRASGNWVKIWGKTGRHIDGSWLRALQAIMMTPFVRAWSIASAVSRGCEDDASSIEERRWHRL